MITKCAILTTSAMEEERSTKSSGQFSKWNSRSCGSLNLLIQSFLIIVFNNIFYDGQTKFRKGKNFLTNCSQSHSGVLGVSFIKLVTIIVFLANGLVVFLSERFGIGGWLFFHFFPFIKVLFCFIINIIIDENRRKRIFLLHNQEEMKENQYILFDFDVQTTNPCMVFNPHRSLSEYFTFEIFGKIKRKIIYTRVFYLSINKNKDNIK